MKYFVKALIVGLLPLSYIRASDPPVSTYEELVSRYISYYEAEMPDSAEWVLHSALDLYPNHEGNFILRGNLAELQLARQDTVAALSELSKAIAEQPEVTQLRSRRAEINEQSGHLNDALMDLDELIRLQPTWEIPLYNRARVRHKLNLYSGAINDLEQIMKLNPTAYLPRVALAKAYEADGDALKAEKLLTHLIDKYPKMPIAYRELGWLLLRQDRKSEALDNVRHIINELKRADGEDYLLRGAIWMRYGEVTLAEKDFYEAKRLGITESRINEVKNDGKR